MSKSARYSHVATGGPDGFGLGPSCAGLGRLGVAKPSDPTVYLVQRRQSVSLFES